MQIYPIDLFQNFTCFCSDPGRNSDLSSNQCSLGSTYVNTNLLLTHMMPFSTQLGTQCFKMRLGMVGLLSAVKIKSNTRVIIKKPKFKQTIYQLPSMTLKLLAMLPRITWTAEIGACPNFLSKFLNNSSFHS